MSTPSITFRQIKRFIPASVKRAAKNALLNRAFRRAVGAVSGLPLGAVPRRELLSDLITGWGNEGFAAQLDYLEEVAEQATKTEGPVLECGSGLTTILVGLLAGRRGVETCSLEHFPAWRARVNETLARFEIPNVQICDAQLRSFGEFEWYDAPLGMLPTEFQLVICDGPPGMTNGGRYGLLPVMREHLTRGAIVLLDDAARPGEAEVLQRWVRETRLRILSPADSKFAVLEIE